MKKSIPQFEFGFSAEPMRLVAETALDGDRMAAEAARRVSERGEAEAAQMTLRAPQVLPVVDQVRDMAAEKPSTGPLILTGLQRFRLAAGDLIELEGCECRVIRVSESAAVVSKARAAREIVTRFGEKAIIQPAPALVRISPNSEVRIISKGGAL